MTELDPNQLNPFLSSEQADLMVRSAMADLLKMAMLTTQTDEELTQRYLALASVSISRSLGNGPEDLDGLYAQFWTLALLVNSTMEENASIGTDAPDCGHEECAKESAHQAAFVEAAARGDVDAAINVVRAVVKTAHAEGVPPWQKLLTQLVMIIASMATSMLEQWHHDHHGQTPENN
jgi:hypothetical protein